MLLFLALAALVLTVDLGLYRNGSFSSRQRLRILQLSGGLGAVLFATCVAAPAVWPRPSRARVAQTVEARHAGLKNGLMTTAQAGSAAISPHVSPALLARCVRWTAEACSGLDFRRAIPLFTVNASAAACLVCAGGLGYAVLRDPGSATEAWRSFASDYTTIQVEPGDTGVQYGESLRIEAKTSGRLTLDNWLHIRDTEGAAGSQPGRQEVKLVEERGAPRRFVHVVGPVHRPFTYKVRADRTESRDYLVKLKNPKILSIQHSLRYPDAFGLDPEQRQGGEIRTFPGVAVSLHAKWSEPLRSAQVAMSDGSTLEMEVEGTAAYGQFTVRQAGTYHILAVDLDGDRNLDTDEHGIATITTPELRLLVPGSREMLPHSLLPLRVWTGDDLGVMSMDLRYKLRSEERGESGSPEHVETLDMVSAPRPIQLFDLTWHLRDRCLAVGETVTYRVEAKDEHGNTSFSPWHSIQVTEQSASERYEQTAQAGLLDAVQNQEREKWPRRYQKMLGAYFDRLAKFSRGEAP
jgi:hypothetical protein